MAALSERLAAVVDALPLRPGMRVLEIGCGPGAALREVAARIGLGYALGLDRSARALARAKVACARELAAGRVGFVCVAIEDFVLPPDEAPFDLAFAARVGVLDGRHPGLSSLALQRLRLALRPRAALYVGDGPDMQRRPLR